MTVMTVFPWSLNHSGTGKVNEVCPQGGKLALRHLHRHVKGCIVKKKYRLKRKIKKKKKPTNGKNEETCLI